ncbi:G-protein coupled receptor Mth-like [Octopus vulgaris]|uniref:G-protein coupled receptor Mth-like n=1 Tax=Octopus vulgaris TaxID=6645 RepID=A0AA36B455_OCTVU|nr:G-protein coupled receptor Mth-like [Octopus vulgaris]
MNHVVLTSNSNLKCFNTTDCEFCSFAKQCHMYNRCCCNEDQRKTVESEYFDPSIYYSCSLVQDKTYYIFDRCPSNHSDISHVTRCEYPKNNDSPDNIPVFGETSKRLYMNRYCALCHTEKYILWDIVYDCDNTVNINRADLMNMIENGKCSKRKAPPDNLKPYLMPCISSVSKCSPQILNETLEHQCPTLEKPRCTSSNDYTDRNILCCSVSTSTSSSRKGFPLTIIFNYNIKYLTIKEKIDGTEIETKLPFCPKYTNYDKNTMRCRKNFYHPILNCTATRLKDSEYHITSDGLLYLNITQLWLNQSEFSIDEDGLSICVKNDNDEISKYSEIETYITLVGLAISVPALAITIIVYLCIPDLRTLPGKLLISLSSALFVAELLFLISSQVTTSTVLCKSSAVVMHYAFLATFFWTNVMSFDAWNTFSRLTQLRSSENDTKKLVLYSLYAWICPLLIVTVSLIFEYTPGNRGFSPEYGIATRLKDSEYHITSDGLLYLNITQLWLNQSEFSIDEDGLSICVKNDNNGISKYSEIEIYITLVGLAISVPALAITIIVYLCIPDLRTLPGITTKTL